MRARRDALSSEEQRALSREICERLGNLETVEKAPMIAAYLATAREANLDEAIARWLSMKTIVVPSLGLKPRFDTLESLEKVRTNARGWRIPLSETKIAAHECEVILVPGLAFDMAGNRLGQGGGWYDRTLERSRQKGRPLVIGICFSCQIIETVPCEKHDARMDFVVTEDRVLDCGEEK